MKDSRHIVSRSISMILIAVLLIAAIYPVLWLILCTFKTQTEFTMNSAFFAAQVL